MVSTLARDGKPLLQEVLVTGLGHAWSGGDDGRTKPDDRVKYPYNDPQGPDASRMMWDLLRAAHPFRQPCLCGSQVT